MAALMRAHDWRATSLGQPDGWIQPLKTLVEMMLAAGQPMFIAFGPDHLLLYNDDYAPMLADRHPRALGRPFFEVWSDARETVEPLFLQAFAGEPVHMRDIELFLDRPGRPREAHFAFSYTPLRDEAGEIVGVFCPCVETTEQVLAERERAQAAERQRRLLQQMPGFVSVLSGPDHIYEYVNDAYLEIAGRDGFIGRSVREMFPELEGQGFHELLDHVYRGGEPFIARAMPIRLDRAGGERFIDFIYQPIRDGAGAVTGIFVGGYDVTPQVQGERELRQSRARLGAALAAARLGVFEWSPRDGALVLDDRAREIFGFGPDEESTAKAMFGRIDPADVGRVRAEAQASLASLSRLRTEFRLASGTAERPGRSVVSISDVAAGADGAAEWMIGVVEDVTELRAAERRLAETEGRYRQIVEGAEDFAIVALDERGRIASWNTGAERVTGFSQKEAVGRPIDIVFTSEDRAADVPGRELERARREGRAVDERWHQGKDDARFWGSGLTMRLDAQGGFLKMFRDRTPEHRAEAAVREREERLRELNETLEQRVAEALAERKLMADVVETTDACIQALDPNFRILAINKANVEAYARLYGVRPKVGDNLLDLLADAPDLGAIKARWERAFAGEAYALSAESGSPTPGRRRYDRRFETLRGPGGERIGAFLTSVDATQRLRAKAELEATQEALRHAQKMEAVGQLTGGIAHDFNNMLAAVIGSLDLLGRRLGDGDERARRYIDAAMDGARRAASLTQRLLAFSRQQPLRPESTDVNGLVAGMSDLLRHSLGAQVVSQTALAEGLWRVNVDPNQLENLLLNLAVNSRDAMPDGGRLTIETRNVELDARDAAGHPGAVPGQYVLLSVSDTGCGMAPEVIAKAFDPFFTTKKVGKGTGLGLSQAYGFVRQSGGHMNIVSQPGQGAAVKVYLPRLAEARDERSAPFTRAGAASAAAGEVVLVVEDEPAVRRFSVEALGELGYRPIEADGPSAALRLLDAHPEIGLMFTDVVMPEMNGARLAEEARRRRPDLKVLFTTGYTRDAVVHNGVLDAGVDLIAKPFTVAELAARLREVLSAPRAAG